MKKLRFGTIYISVVGFSFSFVCGALQAQDPVAVAPTSFKVVLENERVRVVEAQFGPGVKNATHSHPDYVIYPLTSYKIKSTAPDGSEKLIEIAAGTPRWSAAVTHSDENVGTRTLTHCSSN
jgi:beta-alanine degradation protein BauB